MPSTRRIDTRPPDADPRAGPRPGYRPDASQEDTLAFLLDPAAWGEPAGAEIAVHRTHISIVLLAGARALKLKRAVRLPYLDFSTPALRLAACDRELELNRRTAPRLYRRVRRITRDADGRLALDGAGVLVDAVLEMDRFDDDCLLDRVARRGGLTALMAERLAGAIARFHAAESPAPGGGADAMAAVLDANRQAFAHAGVLDPAAVAALDEALRQRLSRLAPLLDARAAAGLVRRCHGDLHLRNICLLDGEPTLFDCLEFSDALATIDVLYDLAFLLMDLCHRKLPDMANVVFNRYLDAWGDSGGVALLPFFMAVRAQVRAHVEAAQSRGDDERDDNGGSHAGQARAYLDLSRTLLRHPPARLIVVSGPSGSGKSTTAAAIAGRLGALPGARVISSDRVRKRLHGVDARTALPPDAYRPEVSRRVYDAMVSEAELLLAQGWTVIADAVFNHPESRLRIEDCARQAGVPLRCLWLTAPPEVLRARVAARRNDPSDADPSVLERQLARTTPPAHWIHVDADGTVDEVAGRALAAAGAVSDAIDAPD